MGSSVPGVLAVHEGGYVLAVALAVGEHYLYVLSYEVDGLVAGSLGQGIVHQVQESVLGFIDRTVQVEAQSLLEIGVVLDHSLHILQIVVVVHEHKLIRGEAHQGAVLLLRLPLALVHELAPLELRKGGHPVTERLDIEMGGEGIHRLGTHAVEAYGFLEGTVVILSSRVQHAYRLDHGIERYASSEVPDADALFVHLYLNGLAVVH